MELSKETIHHLASLARLEFNEEETRQISEDLKRMITFVEKLQELDTTGVEPLLHMTENVDIFRADTVQPSLDRATAMAIAPDADNEYFFVPKVIKK
ncbi:MAG TPA: Asp-tRNA(Asn)/Glu-tRNA(Gln) amidotransferase subunit GatC [Flavihumibacter sp.]|nr:Asp-tRNA(Asn)/Glu-tRNA(Gln) amidotransferase subunit GatC [Bacteroidota bacterium]HOA38678.1 Asp-tRNA(Asn)/Glu-tRNA(Gln) amidotransferase subunit GatC [Flavihumibacter sp.]HPZ86800.1 Asp-tRNA(Asn)/Glu-tRNA(Gln) amidotransferase subunit GatC [Flavihumibacter sp.]HQD08766.1 Asp-tRNA(Asn)/Glu-tRNA(Gln) amidotransferase subunit GatC [Flavihumibacter sp.]